MERKFINQLLEWKNSTVRMPLIVTGARQVGKKNFGFENGIRSVPLYAAFCF